MASRSRGRRPGTFHPVDAALFATCALLGGVLAGAGAPGAAWFVVGRRAWTVLLHANIAWPTSALDRIVATPAFHHRHHREDRAPANFASTLPVLDHLFGTWSGDDGHGVFASLRRHTEV